MPHNPTADETEQLSDLIGAIYDCVVDPDRWDATLDGMRRLMDCANVVLYVVDPTSGAHRLNRMVGISPEWAARLPSHENDLAELHAEVADFYTRPLDEPFVCHQDIKTEHWLANGYYRDWAKPQGIVDVIDTILIRKPERVASCALCRHERVGLITERETRLARLIAPHIRRAVTVSDMLDMRSLTSNALTGTLDAIAVGIILVDGDGSVVHANRTAHRMFEAGEPVRAVGGCLQAADAETTARLREVIARATEHEAGIAAAGIGMALSAGDDAIATAHILPLAAGDVRTRLFPRAVAGVFVSTNAPPAVGALDAVAEAYHLTPSEARLLGRLILGEGTTEAAAALDIAVSTAKTHIARLLAKTGSRRQTDLLALVNRLTPAVSGPQAVPADTPPHHSSTSH